MSTESYVRGYYWLIIMLLLLLQSRSSSVMNHVYVRASLANRLLYDVAEDTREVKGLFL
jgi:hypothetical protein